MARNTRFADEENDRGSLVDKKIADLKKQIAEGKKERKAAEKEIAMYEAGLRRSNNLERWASERENEKALSELRRDAYLEEGKIQKAIGEEVAQKLKETFKVNLDETLANAAATLTSKLDPIIDNYIEQQQAMKAHLNGYGSTLESLTDNLQNALSSSKLVQQEKVYSNLSKLIKEGIVQNAEQRAFLQTIADDIALTFNAADSKLVQLIQIQQKDLTANRLAIEYSLQTFLNQNYQTSTYIKDAFETVSQSLFETQSLMTSASGLQLEATLQTWLGSMNSAGVSTSTVTSLAEAFNKLGSGNIDGLGTGISNLVLMGVARAGLDYGDLLTNGITASNANKIMQGITTYLGEMGAQSSNVVKSQLSSIFGVNIADLAAISNLNATSGGATTSIYDALFNNYGELVPLTTQVTNLLNNAFFSWGTNIASSPLALISYKVEEMVADTLGTILDGVEITAGFLGPGITVNLGKIAKAAPLLTLLPTALQTIFGDMLPSALNGGLSSNLSGVFNALAEGTLGTLKYAGTGLGTTSGVGTSASIYAGNGETSDILNSNQSSMQDFLNNNYTSDEETYNVSDVYKKLLEWGSIPDNQYKIDSSNAIKVAYTEDDPMLNHTISIDENVKLIVSRMADVIDAIYSSSRSSESNYASYGTNRYSGLA